MRCLGGRGFYGRVVGRCDSAEIRFVFFGDGVDRFEYG